MNLGHASGFAVYLGIFFASAVEGEIVFVAASTLVGMGRLEPWAVLVSGALGAAAGDQFYYYATRGWLGDWVQRLKFARKRREALLQRVRAHGAWMGFAVRFLPGVRIAVSVSCATANVRPLQFSTANLIGAFTWAGAVMGFVAWGGPAWFARLGLPHWCVWLAPALIVLGVLAYLSRLQLSKTRIGGA